jgi:hypothetical protein
MKKSISVIVCVFVFTCVMAQMPIKMSYQAVVRNAGNQLVVNQNVGMRISILQGSISGTAVFVETHSPLTNLNGLVTLEVGGGNPVTGTFATINWANGLILLKRKRIH